MDLEVGLNRRIRDADLTFASTETEAFFILAAHLPGHISISSHDHVYHLNQMSHSVLKPQILIALMQHAGFTKGEIEVVMNVEERRIGIRGGGYVANQESVTAGTVTVTREVAADGFDEVFRVPDGAYWGNIDAWFDAEEEILIVSIPKLMASSGVGAEEMGGYVNLEEGVSEKHPWREAEMEETRRRKQTERKEEFKDLQKEEDQLIREIEKTNKSKGQQELQQTDGMLETAPKILSIDLEEESLQRKQEGQEYEHPKSPDFSKKEELQLQLQIPDLEALESGEKEGKEQELEEPTKADLKEQELNQQEKTYKRPRGKTLDQMLETAEQIQCDDVVAIQKIRQRFREDREAEVTPLYEKPEAIELPEKEATSPKRKSTDIEALKTKDTPIKKEMPGDTQQVMKEDKQEYEMIREQATLAAAQSTKQEEKAAEKSEDQKAQGEDKIRVASPEQMSEAAKQNQSEEIKQTLRHYEKPKAAEFSFKDEPQTKPHELEHDEDLRYVAPKVGERLKTREKKKEVSRDLQQEQRKEQPPQKSATMLPEQTLEATEPKKSKEILETLPVLQQSEEQEAEVCKKLSVGSNLEKAEIPKSQKRGEPEQRFRLSEPEKPQIKTLDQLPEAVQPAQPEEMEKALQQQEQVQEPKKSTTIELPETKEELHGKIKKEESPELPKTSFDLKQEEKVSKQSPAKSTVKFHEQISEEQLNSQGEEFQAKKMRCEPKDQEPKEFRKPTQLPELAEPEQKHEKPQIKVPAKELEADKLAKLEVKQEIQPPEQELQDYENLIAEPTSKNPGEVGFMKSKELSKLFNENGEDLEREMPHVEHPETKGMLKQKEPSVEILQPDKKKEEKGQKPATKRPDQILEVAERMAARVAGQEKQPKEKKTIPETTKPTVTPTDNMSKFFGLAKSQQSQEELIPQKEDAQEKQSPDVVVPKLELKKPKETSKDKLPQEEQKEKVREKPTTDVPEQVLKDVDSTKPQKEAKQEQERMTKRQEQEHKMKKPPYKQQKTMALQEAQEEEKKKVTKIPNIMTPQIKEAKEEIKVLPTYQEEKGDRIAPPIMKPSTLKEPEPEDAPERQPHQYEESKKLQKPLIEKQYQPPKLTEVEGKPEFELQKKEALQGKSPGHQEAQVKEAQERQEQGILPTYQETKEQESRFLVEDEADKPDIILERKNHFAELKETDEVKKPSMEKELLELKKEEQETCQPAEGEATPHHKEKLIALREQEPELYEKKKEQVLESYEPQQTKDKERPSRIPTYPEKKEEKQTESLQPTMEKSLQLGAEQLQQPMEAEAQETAHPAMKGQQHDKVKIKPPERAPQFKDRPMMEQELYPSEQELSPKSQKSQQPFGGKLNDRVAQGRHETAVEPQKLAKRGKAHEPQLPKLEDETGREMVQPLDEALNEQEKIRQRIIVLDLVPIEKGEREEEPEISKEKLRPEIPRRKPERLVEFKVQEAQKSKTSQDKIPTRPPSPREELEERERHVEDVPQKITESPLPIKTPEEEFDHYPLEKISKEQKPESVSLHGHVKDLEHEAPEEREKLTGELLHKSTETAQPDRIPEIDLHHYPSTAICEGEQKSESPSLRGHGIKTLEESQWREKEFSRYKGEAYIPELAKEDGQYSPRATTVRRLRRRCRRCRRPAFPLPPPTLFKGSAFVFSVMALVIHLFKRKDQNRPPVNF
ncbi:hypothetical protein AXF42_Ash018809 [Apostasia shenzhenica]|uniref:SHSP domain-containing protein n=1 Tax=Apostasia shenzhenica TaxID=1088818 RepID=A0A2I0B152_9ASPA|nr:hypothetical protein AXF42_Ash018809 [Apostasia shenzhenica]